MVWSPKDPHRCPACKRPVYPAEQIIATDRTPYHRMCVRCVGCKTGLTPGSLTEKDGQIYCRVCFSKFQNHYAQNGYGQGQMSDEERSRLEREKREREMLEAAQLQFPPGSGQSAVDGRGRKEIEFHQLDVRSLTTIAPSNEIVACGL